MFVIQSCGVLEDVVMMNLIKIAGLNGENVMRFFFICVCVRVMYFTQS